MQFRDPILAADGELIRAQMRSPNYVPGEAGWKIGRDGSAELNNVTARGTIATGADGEARWEISSDHADTIDGFTGDPDEADPATLTTGIAGAGASRYPFLNLEPADIGTDRSALKLRSGRPDASEPATARLEARGGTVYLEAAEVQLVDTSLTTGPVIHLGVVPAAPPAPAFGALLYVQDAGGGKVRLRVKFPTGSAITLATEP